MTFTFEEGGTLDGVERFLAAVRDFDRSGDLDCYFRGEPRPRATLRPSVGRPHEYAGACVTFTAAQERLMLHRFRRHAYGHFHRVPTEWETLFLARHHGLPTRLLDWTANPLVALYFAAFHDSENLAFSDDEERAVRRNREMDGTVWAVQARPRSRPDLDVFDERISPLRMRGIKLIHPFYPTTRMTAQSGVFTLHSAPRRDMVSCAGRRYRDTDLDVARLARWTLSSAAKNEVILDLERMAVDSRTLFPDLEGLAKGLWQTEVLRARRRA